MSLFRHEEEEPVKESKPVTVTDGITELKNLVRVAKKVAAAEIDGACDAVSALLNHEAELKASVEALKVEHAEWLTRVEAARGEHASLAKAALAAEETKRRAEAALKSAQSSLADVKQKITALLA